MTSKPTIELTCAHTGEKFLKNLKDYKRRTKLGQTLFYKDNKTASIAVGLKKKRKPIIRKCPYCEGDFSVIPSPKSSLYCSKSCQELDKWRGIKADEKRYNAFCEKAAITTRLMWQEGKLTAAKCGGRNRMPDESIDCPICKTPFNRRPNQHKKTCSKNCSVEFQRRRARANPNCGGETNYRHWRYKDIAFDSSWEVEIAKWLDEHGIAWQRSRQLVFWWTDGDGKRRRYYPDFYLPTYNLYLDPKNKYLIGKDRFKIEAVQREHAIKIVWGLKDDILQHLKSLIRV